MTIGLSAWARFAARHPWRVLGTTIAVMVGLVVLYAVARGSYAETFAIPGTESQRLITLLKERFPQTAGDTATVVVRAPAGINDPQVHQRIDTLLADVKTLPDVLSATSPYDSQGAISPDGTIARITVQYDKQSSAVPVSSAKALIDLRARESSPDFQVEAGGSIVRHGEMQRPGQSEFLGIAAAVVILLVAFGSVAAMGVPIVTALLALLAGFLLVGVGASLVSMPSFTPEFASMIGIGVGIDYALLIVTRFREGLGRGLSVEDSIVTAASTAGRSVTFAGCTVIVAMLGLWAVGIPFISYVGSAGALVVALSVLVALVVLPAILSLVGTRIDRLRIPHLTAAVHETETGFGYRLSRLVQRAPLLFLAVSLGLLLLLSVPVLRMNLGVSDSGDNPTSYTSRRAYDLLSQGFGPGFNGPILVGIRIDNADAAGQIEALPAELQQVRDVAAVSPVQFNDTRSAAVITVIPSTSPQAQQTEKLVHDLRAALQRDITSSTGKPYVGGSTAAFIDVSDKITSRLAPFFGAVIGLSFLLLMAVFRSVLVPLKAAVMNLLSIGAAYGVVVAIFQWGWGAGLIGVHRQGPIESFLPMMLFAILFGLSMDYEVFLVSRIQEEYLATGRNSDSVARGLSVTTRVITAAAAIMVAVFLSFVFGDQRVIKEFGIGLAAAIFVDATLVRLILVPSLMQLLGDANWWFPRWLDRVLPRIGLHGEPALALVNEPVEKVEA